MNIHQIIDGVAHLVFNLESEWSVELVMGTVCISWEQQDVC